MSAQNSGREGKDSGHTTPFGTTPDLFAAVRVTDEWSLGQRLLQQGADLYCDGEFATAKDRLRYVIQREQFAAVVVGRHEGKLEDYAQAFERVTGSPLAPKKARAKA